MGSPTPTPTPKAQHSRLVEALVRWRGRVRALPGGAVGWRISITVIGIAIVIAGIILLPLPGPGWAVIFAGLGVLATEYVWAARLLNWARRMFAQRVRKVMTTPLRHTALVSAVLIVLAGAALLGLCSLGVWLIVHD